MLSNLVVMCEAMGFFKLILFGICWKFWIYKFISFTRFQEFLAIVSSFFFPPVPYFLLSFWTLIAWILDLLVSHSILGICFYFFFLLFIFYNFYWIIFRLTDCSLCVRSDLCVHYPVTSLGLGQWSTLQFSSQCLAGCLRSDSCMRSLEVSPRVHTQLYRITLLSCILSVISLTFSGSLVLPSQSSGQKVKALVFPLCTLPTIAFASRAKWQEAERKQQLFALYSWDHNLSGQKGFLSCRVLGTCPAVATTIIAAGLLETMMWYYQIPILFLFLQATAYF